MNYEFGFISFFDDMIDKSQTYHKIFEDKVKEYDYISDEDTSFSWGVCCDEPLDGEGEDDVADVDHEEGDSEPHSVNHPGSCFTFTLAKPGLNFYI